jgi:hypothetical protein
MMFGNNSVIDRFLDPSNSTIATMKIPIYDDNDYETDMPVDLARFVKMSNDYILGKLKIVHRVETFNDSAIKSYKLVNPAFEFRRLAEVERVVGGETHFRIDPVASSITKTASGAQLSLDFDVHNLSVGHDFPSALFANISKTWFDLTVYDRTGRVVASRTLDEYDYSNQLGRIEVHADGKHIEPVDNPHYTEIINRKFLSPGKPYRQNFASQLAEGYLWPFRVRVGLMSQRYTGKYSALYAKKGVHHRVQPSEIAAWEGMIYPRETVASAPK